MAENRNHALDGLRGWAALIVCAFHLFVETFRFALPEIANPVVAVILNGHLPIAIFFILSGYVLTYGGWRGPKTPVVRQMVKRYPRLFIPVAAVVVVVYLLMLLGLTRHGEGYSSFQMPWIGGTLFEPGVGDALAFATFWTFVGVPATQNYHPFLWTMPFELLGSLLVLILCFLERGGRRAYFALGIVSAVLLVVLPLMAGFFIGALLSLMKVDGRLPDISRWAWPAVIAAVLAQGIVPDDRMIVAASTIVIVAAVSGGGFRAFLDNPLSQWLGRLSFPIYLVQWPIIITVTAWLGLGAVPLTVSDVLWIGSVSMAATLVAAQVFYPVEKFTTWACRRIGNLVPELPLARARPASPTDFA